MQMNDTFESLMFIYWLKKNVFKSKIMDNEVYIHCVQYENKIQIVGDVKTDLVNQNMERNYKMLNNKLDYIVQNIQNSPIN